MTDKRQDKTTFDESVVEDQYTDTSMFDAEDIVRKVEEYARQRQENDEGLSARKRYELLKEEKRLRAELCDYDEAFDLALDE